MTRHLSTKRLTLRPFRADDLEDFIALHADPDAMRDYGMTLSVQQAEQKHMDYLASADRYGIGRFRVSDQQGFVGYVGVKFLAAEDHPLGSHHEVGWRLLPRAWGKGYATEAAGLALRDAFRRLDLKEIITYTAPDNLKSQAVMERLRLTRRADLDFTLIDPLIGEWHGLVWSAQRTVWAHP